GHDAVKAAITAAWDRGAPAYDRLPRHGILHDDERRAWRRLVAAILGDATHSEVPRREVLDIGTGTGTLALLAAELGHEVIAVDLSEAMILAARRKSIESGIAVDWRHGDAEDPPVPEGSMDAVVSRHLVWTLPDPALAARAWRNRLRPGGLVAVIDGTYPRRPLPVRLLAAAASRLGGDDDDDAHEYPAEVDARLPLMTQRSPAALMDVLRAAGFERVRSRGLAEIDRTERGHLGLLQRTADGWRRYLVVGRAPRG
ncbi:MAG: class I SAM-dependent methyltransferase, partial [Candidatus Limnocylindrales bacterium]